MRAPVRTFSSAALVILAAASSIATSPRRQYASGEVGAPALEASAFELTPSAPDAMRGVEVTVSQSLVEYAPLAGGTVDISGSVRWLDPPTDPRNAVLAVDFVPVGRAESWSVRKEIEIGRKTAQPIELRQHVDVGECVKGYPCTTNYEVRFTWIEPRGGRLTIAWAVDGMMSWTARDDLEPPVAASITVVPTDPHALERAAEPPPVHNEPDPFPASP